MTTELRLQILDAMTLDSTHDHLVELFGEDELNDYYNWFSENTLDMTGYGDASNILGLIEDMFGMFLMNETNFSNYVEFHKTISEE